jgi:hypothetical protein
MGEAVGVGDSVAPRAGVAFVVEPEPPDVESVPLFEPPPPPPELVGEEAIGGFEAPACVVGVEPHPASTSDANTIAIIDASLA